MMDEVIFINKPLHLNRLAKSRIKVGEDEETGEDKFAPLDLESEEFEAWKEGLYISLDGTIIGVDSSLVTPHISDPNIRNIRYGRAEMPTKFKITCKEDLHKLLALLVPLEDIP